jgi:hypothetical protein
VNLKFLANSIDLHPEFIVKLFKYFFLFAFLLFKRFNLLLDMGIFLFVFYLILLELINFCFGLF